MRALERRSPEVSEMFRQAFLRGISTRGVGRVESVDRIIFSIFSRFNQDWKIHTLKLFTQAA
jgi:hypothetical protein